MDVDSNQRSALVSRHGFDRFPLCMFQSREDRHGGNNRTLRRKGSEKIRSADPKSRMAQRRDGSARRRHQAHESAKTSPRAATTADQDLGRWSMRRCITWAAAAAVQPAGDTRSISSRMRRRGLFSTEGPSPFSPPLWAVDTQEPTALVSRRGATGHQRNLNETIP